MGQLSERDRAHVWHPFTQHQTAGDPLEIVRAEGVHLYDADGNSYLDANSSWWVNTHGHGHPHIGNALTSQFKSLDHTVFAGVTHEKAVVLAERITEQLPDPLNKVFYSDNGSTAVEVALKMAIQYWHNQHKKKHRFIALKGAYHGDTFGAMSVAERGYFNKPFEPYFFDVDYLDFPTPENENEVLQQAEALCATNDVAGIIVEPLVQGAAGMKMYSAEFLDRLITVFRKHNALIIFDEVMTGFGRTGKLFALDHCYNKPDLIALSKGLTAGVMAMGVTVATDEIYAAFLGEETTKALLHGHSFTANPLACAVGCASLDIFELPETWKQIQLIEEWHEEFAAHLKAIPIVKNIRIKGTILAFDIEAEQDSYFSDIKTKAYKHFLANGVLIRPLGNTLFVNPPYCLKSTEYQQIADAILSFLEVLK